jgi:hypothetical protein
MGIIEFALPTAAKIPITMGTRILPAHTSGDLEDTVAKSTI